MDLIKKAIDASTIYEETNTELKIEYIKRYIKLYNSIVSEMPGYKGSFGTGYPFYALGDNLSGELPIIQEQLRYNNELERIVEETGSDCVKRRQQNPVLKLRFNERINRWRNL